MKSFLLVLTGLLPVVCSEAALAQSTVPEPSGPAAAKPRQAIKLGIFTGDIAGGSYERQLTQRTSLQTTLGYWTNSQRGADAFSVDPTTLAPVWENSYRTQEHRAALAVQIRRYLQASKPALVGWFAGAGAQLRGQWTRFRYDDGHTERDFVHDQALQLRFGRQCQLGPRFTVDFALGPELVVGNERRFWRYDPTTNQYTRRSDRRVYARPGFSVALQIGYRL